MNFNSHIPVFTYGTLMRGYGNHRLMAGSRFVAPASTLVNCVLRAHGIPFLSRSQQGLTTLGELFMVPPADFPRIRALEAGYALEFMPVLIDHEGEEKAVGAFFFEHPGRGDPVAPIEWQGGQAYDYRAYRPLT